MATDEAGRGTIDLEKLRERLENLNPDRKVWIRASSLAAILDRVFKIRQVAVTAIRKWQARSIESGQLSDDVGDIERSGFLLLDSNIIQSRRSQRAQSFAETEDDLEVRIVGQDNREIVDVGQWELLLGRLLRSDGGRDPVQVEISTDDGQLRVWGARPESWGESGILSQFPSAVPRIARQHLFDSPDRRSCRIWLRSRDARGVVLQTMELHVGYRTGTMLGTASDSTIGLPSLAREVTLESVLRNWISPEAIVAAARNIGLDLTCSACASVYFTGVREAVEHSSVCRSIPALRVRIDADISDVVSGIVSTRRRPGRGEGGT